MKEELGRDFTVQIVAEYWVLASNLPEEQTARAARLLEQFGERLSRTFFRERSSHPVRVYLFGTEEQYVDYRRKIKGPPQTPYGFYLPGERKIVVNFSTGIGTLAHEMIHALMETDFPDAPPWFNEGFPALFEKAVLSPGGEVQPLVNWRIHTLRKALASGNAPSLRQVLTATGEDFYGYDASVHYAYVRHLCLYLDRTGRLRTFYQQFRERHQSDPSGISLLVELYGKPWDRIEADWIEWVGKLTEE